MPGKEQLKHILDSLNDNASSEQVKRDRRVLGFVGDSEEDARDALYLDDDDEDYVASFEPYGGAAQLGLVPPGLQWEVEQTRDLDVAKLLVDAYRALPHDSFVGVGEFVEYGALQANPLIRRLHEGKPLKLSSGWS